MRLGHREVKIFGYVRHKRVMDECFLWITAAQFSDDK